MPNLKFYFTVMGQARSPMTDFFYIFDFFKYTFSTKGKQMSVVPLVKVWKIAKKLIGSIDLYRRGNDLLVYAL
jgi:hypothetical protein